MPEISGKKVDESIGASLMLEWMLMCTLKRRLVDI